MARKTYFLLFLAVNTKTQKFPRYFCYLFMNMKKHNFDRIINATGAIFVTTYFIGGIPA